jgi:hypothetical protein
MTKFNEYFDVHEIKQYINRLEDLAEAVNNFGEQDIKPDQDSLIILTYEKLMLNLQTAKEFADRLEEELNNDIDDISR